MILSALRGETAIRAADPPDPVVLLKVAREAYQEVPAELQSARRKLPLALVESLCGDREVGRRELAALADEIKAEKPDGDRFVNYARLIRAQLLAGFPDDARRTLEVAETDAKTYERMQWWEFYPDELYVPKVVEAFAEACADDDAIRFIDTRRTETGDSETGKLHDRNWPRVILARAQLKRGDREKAAKTLQAALTACPELADPELPAFWIRIGDAVKAKETKDQLLKDHAESRTFQVIMWQQSALAHAEQGRLDQARSIENVVKKYWADDSKFERFTILAKVGDFEQAAEIARSGTELRARTTAKCIVNLAVLAGRSGKRELAERYFAEYEKLLAERAPAPPVSDLKAEDARLTLANYRLAAGETDAQLRAAATFKHPLLQYAANVQTAYYLCARRLKKGEDFFLPPLEVE